MESYLRTSCKRIISDAQKMEELSNSIPKLLKNLETMLTGLNSCWEGAAWASYQDTCAYYIETLGEIYEYCGKMVGNMHDASQIYMRAEQDVMDEVDSWSL